MANRTALRITLSMVAVLLTYLSFTSSPTEGDFRCSRFRCNELSSNLKGADSLDLPHKVLVENELDSKPRGHKEDVKEETRRQAPKPPPLTPDQVWDNSVGRGCKLVAYMEMTSQEIRQTVEWEPESCWQIYPASDNLDAYGWTSSEMSNEFAKAGLETLLDQLEIKGDPAGVSLRHLTGGTDPDGLHYSGTNGKYDNFYYADQGMIIALNNWSPAKTCTTYKDYIFDKNRALPRLAQWSDLVFLTYQDLALRLPPIDPADSSKLTPLRYVIRNGVVNKDTQLVIDRALEKSGQGPAGNFADKRPIGMDSEAGKALLGTPNGDGVSWLLVQHKSRMGGRRVKDVTVFLPEGGGAGKACLLFRIVGEGDE
ncbi:hypothetical protein K402DRAFT_425840 [Aulographum hederae CBS 113979]|uniref:Uncharacterized protein n=1 Tax=Aulographum hederae CBS 113979 TaxID=1176131 RepID=A0A6G1GJC3_9PEZI|nr:hypothetical protein K402DRAFT_425840 [Aulographum hederae CBS 113979]